MVNRKPNGDGKLFSFPLPPLPEDLPLPPLPVIHDKILYQRATTHTSLYAVARITHDLDTANYVQINDYEKMEYMGDRLLGKGHRLEDPKLMSQGCARTSLSMRCTRTCGKAWLQ